MSISVQEADFDVGSELAALSRGDGRVGAVASFVGLVRDTNEGSDVAAMTLEHYPGMTEKALAKILAEAHSRWDILALRAIHRIGRLQTGDQIVFVAVSSAHRGDAFAEMCIRDRPSACVIAAIWPEP